MCIVNQDKNQPTEQSNCKQKFLYIRTKNPKTITHWQKQTKNLQTRQLASQQTSGKNIIKKNKKHKLTTTQRANEQENN